MDATQNGVRGSGFFTLSSERNGIFTEYLHVKAIFILPSYALNNVSVH